MKLMLVFKNIKYIAFFISFFFTSFPAKSLDEFDFNLLNERLIRLEGELADIQKNLYTSGDGGQTENKKSAISSKHEIRINKLENDFRKITGRFEELFFRLDQLQENLNRITSDMDFRLSNIDSSKNKDTTKNRVDTYAYPDNRSGVDASGGDTEILGMIKDNDMEESSSQLAQNFQTPKSLFQYGKTSLMDLDYKNAEIAFRGFIKKYPKNDLVPDAQYWIGESLFVREEYNEAILMYGQVIKNYKKSKKAPDSLLKIGISFANLDKKKEACDALVKVNKNYPDSDNSVLKRANFKIQEIGCKT